MVAKAPSVKRYAVRLSAEEHQQLEAMIRKGKSPAQRLLKARRNSVPGPEAVTANSLKALRRRSAYGPGAD